MNSDFHADLIAARNVLLQRVVAVFTSLATEAHLLGSVARGNPDPYSDIDMWISIPDDQWQDFAAQRMGYVSQIGELIHLCEPPQNAPLSGIFTSAFFKNGDVITVVDFYFCPVSAAFTTAESKNLFGSVQLPESQLSLNPQKIPVPESYRVDFFMCFVFGSIKKLVRRVEQPLEAVLAQYENLNSEYGFQAKALLNPSQTFDTLEDLIQNTIQVATENQRSALMQFSAFALKVRQVEQL